MRVSFETGRGVLSRTKRYCNNVSQDFFRTWEAFFRWECAASLVVCAPIAAHECQKVFPAIPNRVGACFCVDA